MQQNLILFYLQSYTCGLQNNRKSQQSMLIQKDKFQISLFGKKEHSLQLQRCLCRISQLYCNIFTLISVYFLFAIRQQHLFKFKDLNYHYTQVDSNPAAKLVFLILMPVNTKARFRAPLQYSVCVWASTDFYKLQLPPQLCIVQDVKFCCSRTILMCAFKGSPHLRRVQAVVADHVSENAGCLAVMLIQ